MKRKRRDPGRARRGEQSGTQEHRGMVTGVCWYRADQYERLLEKAVDRDSLPGTHAEWLASATKALMQLRASGLRVDPVEVDVEAILRWCRLVGRPFDGAARTEYVADLLQKRHGGGGR